MKHVLIIGGGISGLCSAYYLVKEGYQVSILDKNDLTNGASFINAGYIVPSHFISMAAPGMITKGLKWMFNSSSPFYIKPRLDTEFFKWALHFKRAATAQNVERSIPVLKHLNLKSKELYEEMLFSADFPFHYSNEGLLMAYKSPEGEEEELKIAERAVTEGLEAQQLDNTELRRLQPAFSKKIIGAIHYKCDSHTTPQQFMASLKNWLENNGVAFYLQQEVRKINTFRGKIISVETQDLSLEANEFVLATGSWTSGLAKDLGLNIPIQGGKGYSTNVYRNLDISIPAILVEAKVAVTPMNSFTRFAGTMEFSGNNTIIRKNRIEAIAKAVNTYYPEIKLSEKEKAAAVSGLRPVSPDGLPFLGRSGIYSNLTLGAGHGMMGWSLGPITGKLIAQTISQKKTLVNMQPFNPDRYHLMPKPYDLKNTNS